MNVLNRLKKAFPNSFEEKAVYTAFRIGPRATIYVGHNNSDIARINEKYLKNFPNAPELARYISQNRIQIMPSKSHPDALIDISHIDSVIKIIRKEVGEEEKWSEVEKGNDVPKKADCEMAVAALRKSGKGSSISKEEVFRWLELEFQRRGISLKRNWKVIIERNLDIWFG